MDGACSTKEKHKNCIQIIARKAITEESPISNH